MRQDDAKRDSTPYHAITLETRQDETPHHNITPYDITVLIGIRQDGTRREVRQHDLSPRRIAQGTGRHDSPYHEIGLQDTIPQIGIRRDMTRQ